MGADAVIVYAGDDPVLIAMAETLLRDAGISFLLIENAEISSIEVARDREAAALAVLDEMPEGSEVDDEAADSAWNQ